MSVQVDESVKAMVDIPDQHQLVMVSAYSTMKTLMCCTLFNAAIVCDQLADPENGEVSQPDPAIVRSVAVYTCNHGFELDGASKRVCQADGTYSQQPPVCVGALSWIF